MPRKSRKYQKRRKSPFTLSNTQKVANTAYTAFKTAKIAMSLLNVEVKHFDTSATTTIPSGAWTVTPLFQIPQGNTDESRNGEKLRVKSLNTKLVISKASNPSNTCVRIVLVKVPIVSTETNPATQVFNGAYFQTFRNMEYTKKFRVVWDKTVSLNSISSKKFLSKFNKLDLPVSYTSGAGDSIEANGYYLMTLSDSQSSGDNPTVTIRTRTRYIDN